MKVYQPCYYNGELYRDAIEVDSKSVYKELSDALKEIENYKIFDMREVKYGYARESYAPDIYEDLIFKVIEDGAQIDINGCDMEFTVNLRKEKQGYAYIKVFELK